MTWTARRPWYQVRHREALVHLAQPPQQSEGLDALTTVADLTLASRPLPEPDINDVLDVHQIHLDATPQHGFAQFAGDINIVRAASQPHELRLVGTGPLARTRQVRRGEDLDLSGQTDGQAIQTLLTACGIPFNPSDILDCGYVLGAESPILWRQDQPASALLSEIDRVFFTKTMEIMGGRVIRIAYTLTPNINDAVRTFVRGQNAEFFGNSRERGDRDRIVNAWRVNGAGLECPGDGDEACTCTVWAYAAGDNPHLGPNIRVASQPFNSELIQDESLARAIAVRLMQQTNRLPDELTIRTFNDPRLRQGHVVGVLDPSYGMNFTPAPAPYTITSVSRRGNEMTLKVVGGAAGTHDVLNSGVHKWCHEFSLDLDWDINFELPEFTFPPFDLGFEWDPLDFGIDFDINLDFGIDFDVEIDIDFPMDFDFSPNLNFDLGALGFGDLDLGLDLGDFGLGLDLDMPNLDLDFEPPELPEKCGEPVGEVGNLSGPASGGQLVGRQGWVDSVYEEEDAQGRWTAWAWGEESITAVNFEFDSGGFPTLIGNAFTHYTGFTVDPEDDYWRIQMTMEKVSGTDIEITVGRTAHDGSRASFMLLANGTLELWDLGQHNFDSESGGPTDGEVTLELTWDDGTLTGRIGTTTVSIEHEEMWDEWATFPGGDVFVGIGAWSGTLPECTEFAHVTSYTFTNQRPIFGSRHPTVAPSTSFSPNWQAGSVGTDAWSITSGGATITATGPTGLTTDGILTGNSIPSSINSWRISFDIALAASDRHMEMIVGPTGSRPPGLGAFFQYNGTEVSLENELTSDLVDSLGPGSTGGHHVVVGKDQNGLLYLVFDSIEYDVGALNLSASNLDIYMNLAGGDESDPVWQITNFAVDYWEEGDP